VTEPDRSPDVRSIAVAGHTGDVGLARSGLDADDDAVRVVAIGALERLGELTDDDLRALADDESPAVRRRVAEVAAVHPAVDLLPLLDDPDARVVDAAAWAYGEREAADTDVVERLMQLATNAADPLVREAAVAALGAIGDDMAVEAIIAACADKPAVRRRAVLALAPFDGPRVDATIRRALSDRDWQVRQAAEDLLPSLPDEPG
jgi:HEAT repeat protein